jgi:hypothetical protein
MLFAIVLLAIVPASGIPGTVGDAGKTTIRIEMLDGERKPLIPKEKVSLAVYNEHGDHVYESREFYSGSSIELVLNLDSSHTYHVAARTASCSKAMSRSFLGATTEPIDLKLLFVPNDARPVFLSSNMKTLKQENLSMWRLLSAGQSEQDAEAWYDALQSGNPDALAGFFGIAQALTSYKVGSDNLLDYYTEIDWPDQIVAVPKYQRGDLHHGLEEDRFFAWVKPSLLTFIKQHLKDKHPDFKTEAFPTFWGHRGATFSVKLVRYTKGNFQLTFNENKTKMIDGELCVRVDTDIDYFRFLLKHVFVESLPHAWFGGVSNPRKVYVIEWHELQDAGYSFTPPYGWMSAQRHK